MGRYVPLLVLAGAFLVALLLPLKIIGDGFLPPDDALADAAKSISGKAWPEILVLRSDYAIDNHIGWHWWLRHVYLWTQCGDESLALFSMAMLFTLVGWSALPWLKRPEAWLITLVLMLGVQTPFMRRFMLGRPFMLSMLALLTILFLWQARGSSPPDKRSCAAMTGLIALAVLLHGVWYFWALPVAAFFLARQFRWAAALAVCWVAGSILGAMFTGRPVVYLSEAWRQAWHVIGLHANQNTLVTELRPTTGNWFPLLLAGGLVVLRQRIETLGAPAPCPARNPLSGWRAWAGSSASRRNDSGTIGACRPWMVLLALDLDLLLETLLPAQSVKRLVLAGIMAVTLFLAATNDADQRWSASASEQPLTANDPNLAGWLPQPGGIFYETDMEFFYHTFFRNPTAPWRYMAGFEPAFMPADDFLTYQQILACSGDPDAYQPWIKKMRPADRLVLSARGDPVGLFAGVGMEARPRHSLVWLPAAQELRLHYTGNQLPIETMSAKEILLEVAEKLPPDATLGNAIYELNSDRPWRKAWHR